MESLHKRIKLSNSLREIIYSKYDGRCTYCGREIAYKDMQVDHIEAVYLQEFKEIENLNGLSNLVPACRQCNFYKSTFSIEQFRNRVQTIPERLRNEFTYKLALTYGIIQ